MDQFTYTIKIAEDLTEEQYNKLVDKFSMYFAARNAKIIRVNRLSNCTILEFVLEILEKAEIIKTIGGITVFIVTAFLGHIIADIYKNMKSGLKSESAIKLNKISANEKSEAVLAHVTGNIEGYTDWAIIKQDIAPSNSMVNDIGGTLRELEIKCGDTLFRYWDNPDHRGAIIIQKKGKKD